VPNGIRKEESRDCSRTCSAWKKVPRLPACENSTISQKIVLKEKRYAETEKLVDQYFPLSFWGSTPMLRFVPVLRVWLELIPSVQQPNFC
jgi:hypothetical protein